MNPYRFRVRLALVVTVGVALSVTACRVPAPAEAAAPAAPLAPRDAVWSSRFCADCHPDAYAEHRANTHGRAFYDEEARLATRGFRRDDCIRCHTPRPVAETGIGMTPMTRWTDLEEGNTCMTCHARAGQDYSRFVGGTECRTAFEPEVGTVAHCASCHRIAGTPDQWSRAPEGHGAGRVCIDCHMPEVERPVAIGQPPRVVHSHRFPASSSEEQLRRAYRYEANVVANEVVVRITNRGAGHNFPTANRQRAVESLVIVRDANGVEVARSRLQCRYPYASELEPHQTTPPRGSQIPSGATTEHRVPLGVADGTVECRLYFKTYRPIDDDDPQLSRCLEQRRLPFSGIAPNPRPVEPTMEVVYPAAPTELADFLSQTGLANTFRAKPGAFPSPLPAGDTPEELERLAAQLESHLPELRLQARQRLAALFPRSADVLVAALARWSNETFQEAKRTLLAVGQPAVPTLLAALDHPHLYVRVHARELLAELRPADALAATAAALRRGLGSPNPLDRRSAALALGALPDRDAAPLLRPLLTDPDWDVVMAAARSLAALGDRGSVPAMWAALRQAPWPETQRELAVDLARLGSSAGVPFLLRGLDADDVLPRELAFSALFSITGVHLGYEPAAPALDRAQAVARLQSWWSEKGGDGAVHAPPDVDPRTDARVHELVDELGGGTDTRPGGDDELIVAELVALGRAAVPGLVEGLTFPSGFAGKRALLCRALGAIGDRAAAPFLAAVLRDPVPAVTEWACQALERVGDPAVVPQLRRYQDRVPTLVGADHEAAGERVDALLARACRTRLLLGDSSARTDLVGLLLSRSAAARELAIGALRDHFGEDRGYRADAPEPERRAAVQRWLP